MSTPPPQQQGYGQPQQPQPGYGQQQYPQAPQQGYAPQPPAKRSRFSKALWIRLAIIPVIIIGYFAYDQFTGQPDTAKAGDCVSATKTNTDDPSVHVVSCSDSSANYKVLKTSSDTSDADKACAGTDYTAAYTESGRDSLVLCLAPNK